MKSLKKSEAFELFRIIVFFIASVLFTLFFAKSVVYVKNGIPLGLHLMTLALFNSIFFTTVTIKTTMRYCYE